MITFPIDVFLSHADEDRKVARKVANSIMKYDIKVFVAHDDIDAGDDWELTLTEKIKDCDVFLVLLSDNFHKAHYTDHEVGIAYGLGKPIIPLRLDNTEPYGFMKKYQARKISFDIEEKEITNLVHKMSTITEKGRSVIDNLIKKFSDAGSFRAANEISDTLFTYTKFTKQQINDIAKAYLDNDQISGGFRSGPRCYSLFKENWKKLDESKRVDLDSMWNESQT